MRQHWIALAAVLTFVPLVHAKDTSPATHVSTTSNDENLWLENVNGKKALDWVKARNAETTRRYASGATFDALASRVRDNLNAETSLPRLKKIGDHYYSMLRDADHKRGIWRRTTLDELRKPDTAWETVIDLDALSASEHENWLWHDVQCLAPEYRHCLVGLSRNGAFAAVQREFDLDTRGFVRNGFVVPESPSTVSWIDANHLLVAADFGPGTMTVAGYPRTVKQWTRGTPLSSAKIVYEIEASDSDAFAEHDPAPGFERDLVTHEIAYFQTEYFVRGRDGKLVRIDVPRDAGIGIKREWMLVTPRSPWVVGQATYPAGSLIAVKFDDYMAGKREAVALFTPDAHTSLGDYSWTSHHLILNLTRDVVGQVEVLTPKANGPWDRIVLDGMPAFGSTHAIGVDANTSDEYLLTAETPIEPQTLYWGSLDSGKREVLKRGRAYFDASRYEVSQHFATSKDGTRIPYFEVAPKDMQPDGSRPTVIDAYGGFEVSNRPGYVRANGTLWLERGGVLVIANTRGGAEYGPAWHQAAVKANRPRVYEDVAAVARDLIARGVTSPAHLGFEGSSNGGLTAGNMLVGYPELFGAVISESPLLDMKRYTHIAAGSSWISEYGDPDKPEEWAFLKTFSPYHLLRRGVKYPPVLFVVATSDDTVGPAHARKMEARMRSMGLGASLYEDMEGGHGGAGSNTQFASRGTMIYNFLWENLK